MMDEDEVSLEAMARQFPVQTGVYTVGPLLVGAVQIANSYVHGVSLLYAGLFTALLLVYSALMTRYQLASWRVSRLTGS